MRIGIIQASSQAGRNELIEGLVRRYAFAKTEVINFGCREDETLTYSYVEISILIGLLIESRAVDFIVTGCSSGQGMMLACNCFPSVVCGYIPTPMDAYLFAQINHGNVVSLPLCQGYTWSGQDNLEQTLAKLFSEPFGQGYPKQEAERKLKDTAFMKEIKQASHIPFLALMDQLDRRLKQKLLSKEDVIRCVLETKHPAICDWVIKEKK